MAETPRTPLTSFIYPLLLAGITGAAWLDGLYARALRIALGEQPLHGVFAEVSDAMLLLLALTMLSGIVACFFASARARWLYVASLGLLSLELLLPVLAGAIPEFMGWIVGNEVPMRLVPLLGALLCIVFARRA